MSSPQAHGSRVAPLPAPGRGTRPFDLPDLAAEGGSQTQPGKEYGDGFSPLILEESQEDPRERAARQADAMMEEAKAQAQAIRDQARQEGYESGYASGQEDGRAAGQARVEAACDNLGRALKVLDMARAGILAVMESELVALAQAACDRILLAPGAVDPALVKRVVREAVLRVGEAERVAVSLHPDDLALVREFRPRLMEEVSGLGRLDLRPDPSLRPGDCRVDSPESHIDATLESRRGQIFQLLGETLRQGERPDMNQVLEEAMTLAEENAAAPSEEPEEPEPDQAAEPEPAPEADAPAEPAAELEDW